MHASAFTGFGLVLDFPLFCHFFHPFLAKALCDGMTMIKSFVARLNDSEAEGVVEEHGITPFYSPNEAFLHPALAGRLLAGVLKEGDNQTARIVERFSGLGADINQFKECVMPPIPFCAPRCSSYDFSMFFLLRHQSYEPSRLKQVVWTEPLALDETKDVRNKLGVSVFDLVLASISGAVQEYVTRHPTDDDYSVSSCCSFPLLSSLRGCQLSSRSCCFRNIA